MNSTILPRYLLASVSLVVALVVSIKFNHNGVLLPAPTQGAMASTTSPGADDYDLKSLSVMNQVILQLRQNYVEPDRIDPAKMLVQALDRVQNQVPEVVALFNAELNENPTEVEIRVGAESQKFTLDGIDSLWAMRFKLSDILAFVQPRVDPTTDLEEVEYAAVNGVLGTLDPHSILLSPKIFSDMESANRGSFGGLGIVIGLRDGKLTVISPMADTPAARAGFKSGDNIVKIDEESTVNMPLDEAVSKLRGEPGSAVVVEVMRTGWSEPHSFNLTREIITVQSVKHQALGDGIAYVEIQNFQDHTAQHMLDALREMDEEMGGIKGLVLDLRNDPGGLLSQAIQVSDAFLRSGTIVSTVGQGDRLREESVAAEAGTQPDYPMVVLVNPGSASASEIVAGALKRNNRALVVGDRTFGKGTVQVLYPFGQGGPALKLTIAQYLTPGGISIQGVGIVPDIQLVPVSMTEDRVDLYLNEDALREGDLEQSLTSSRVDPNVDRPTSVVKFVQEIEEVDPEVIADPDEFKLDFEIDFAKRLLIDAGTMSERTAMLGAVSDVVDRVRGEKLSEIQEMLRGRNVDWTLGATVIQPVNVEITTNRPENSVEVGETIELTVKVTNQGSRPLHQVHAVSRSDYGIFDDHEFLFGRIDAGESRTWTVPVEIPVEDPSRFEKIKLEVFSDMIDLDAGGEFFVTVLGNERPHWGFNYEIDDSAHGNGDGLLQVGEKVDFKMKVLNNGGGAAAETMIYLRNESQTALFLIEAREEIEKLDAGAIHTSTFSFEVKSRPESGNVKIVANVFDSVYREFLSEELELPVEETSGTLNALTGFASIRTADTFIRAGAASYAPKLAIAPAGSSLAVGGQLGEWYLVTWDRGRGWIPAEAAIFAARGEPNAGGVTDVIHFQAPFVSLDATVTRTADEVFPLRGSITDDGSVLDYFVVVQNLPGTRMPQSLKNHYEFVGAASAQVSATVPLLPGMNQITVVARDNDKIASSEEIFVYRDE